MDIVFSAYQPLQPGQPGDELRSRIDAKVRLWTFFQESIDELLLNYKDPEELAREIAGAVIWTLHPEYTGLEIMEEVKLILGSLKLKVPENYAGMYSDRLASVVHKKVEGSIIRKNR
jgi:hypothetical protein